MPDGPATHLRSSLAFSTNTRGRSSGFALWSNGVTTRLDTAEIWSKSNGKGPYRHPYRDIGGYFHLRNTRHQVKPTPVNHGTFVGLIFPQMPSISNFPRINPVEPSDAKLFSDGGTLISRALPTAPEFSISTFAGELAKDGIPSIVGSSFARERTLMLVQARSRQGLRGTGKWNRTSGRNIGGEFLNVEFGWKPLLRGVLDFAKTVKDSSEFIREHSEVGLVSVRRRRALPESSRSTYSVAACLPSSPLGTTFFADCHSTQTVVDKTWFAGAFKYSVPLGDTTRSKILEYEQRANMLLGTRLTPEVLWNLAPWSWAIDWFSNTGDVIKNISALGADRLAMHYGYVMSSSVKTEHTTGRYPQGGGGIASYTMTRSFKTRRRASPYGFGGGWDGMTPRQIAIATSLGLSRAL